MRTTTTPASKKQTKIDSDITLQSNPGGNTGVFCCPQEIGITSSTKFDGMLSGVERSCGVLMRTIGVALFAGLACAQAFPNEVRANDVSVTIDFSKPDDARKQAEVLMTALSSPDNTVTLDLRLIPEIIDDQPNYNVKRVPARGGPRRAKSVKCDDGWTRFGPATESFNIELGTVYLHLVLNILHGTALEAPFQTAACEYAIDGPDVPILVFKGIYAKSVINIPTAIDVELRPIAP